MRISNERLSRQVPMGGRRRVSLQYNVVSYYSLLALPRRTFPSSLSDWPSSVIYKSTKTLFRLFWKTIDGFVMKVEKVVAELNIESVEVSFFFSKTDRICLRRPLLVVHWSVEHDFFSCLPEVKSSTPHLSSPILPLVSVFCSREKNYKINQFQRWSAWFDDICTSLLFFKWKKEVFITIFLSLWKCLADCEHRITPLTLCYLPTCHLHF